MRRGLPFLALLLIALPGCGSGTSSPSSAGQATSEAPSSARPVSQLVGRWEQVHTCATLVASLQDAGLGKIAPAVAGDYFPNSSPKELAAKNDVCSGAKPQRHAHFFTEDGAFGSLDQNDQQVDDGSYTIVDDHVVQIGDGLFEYTINDDTLALRPTIHSSALAQALDHPLAFSVAGWQVAVSYGGQPWKRVDCDGWC